MSLRPAVALDLTAFLSMARRFVAEMDSDMLPGEKTDAFLLEIFEQCLAGHGACLILPGMRGFAAATEIVYPYDHKHGRTGSTLGSWVAPEFRQQGLGRLLERSLNGAMREKGFDTLLLGIHHNSTRAASVLSRPGVESFAHLLVVKLSEAEV